MRWGKVTIIGVGLLGGSIGLALRNRRLAGEVHGFVRRRQAVRESVEAGAVSKAGLDLRQAVTDADLVILCTPIARMRALVDQMLPDLKRSAIVTDVGSVKGPVVRALGPGVERAGAHFVGSHPMAGSEKGGVGAARADLFQCAVCVVTPDSSTNRAALREVELLWRSLGSRVIVMEAAVHDKLVSRTSHLPHLLASALANQVLNPRHDKRQTELCASGFHDVTRVASGSPEMWRDILMANRKNLVRDLDQFGRTLHRLRQMLSEGDASGVETVLRTACDRRAAWKQATGTPCSPE